MTTKKLLDKPKTPNDVCENCIGWGESCSPDWYPDYCDPDAGLACSGYEAKAYKVTYEKYNNPEFKDCQFFSTIEEAEAFKERFSKLSHISNIRITTAST